MLYGGGYVRCLDDAILPSPQNQFGVSKLLTRPVGMSGLSLRKARALVMISNESGCTVLRRGR